MKISRAHSALVLVDVQEKLSPLCDTTIPWLENCRSLLQISQELAVPVVVSEQYPKGLGSTASSLLNTLNDAERHSKVHFSCVNDELCWEAIQNTDKHQLILIGIESHVCILQTALDAHARGKSVFVVEDCISARKRSDHLAAILRMRALGIQIVTREMVIFEWLHKAGTEEFKRISKLYLQ